MVPVAPEGSRQRPGREWQVWGALAVGTVAALEATARCGAEAEEVEAFSVEGAGSWAAARKWRLLLRSRDAGALEDDCVLTERGGCARRECLESPPPLGCRLALARSSLRS
eukprot:4679926-Pleurochrysis_carterae.AAC.1